MKMNLRNIKGIVELKPSNQKSYYGKAKVIIMKNGSMFLKSYDTIVCGITNKGNFKRFWNGYSVTTQNHIKDFRMLGGKQSINKREWEGLKVEKIEK